MAIAAVEELRAEFGEGFSGTIVCPASLMLQWKDFIAEFTGGTCDDEGKWSGGAPCVVVDGKSPVKRDEQYRRIIEERPPYAVVNYNQIVNDYQEICKLPWDYAIADEVTQIKGFDSDRTQALKTIRPDFIYGLTGDPVENAAEDLFCIMEWIDPTVLGNWERFDNFYCVRAPQGWVIKSINLDVLHQVMNDSEAWVIKRASDPDVVAFMPERKPSETLWVSLDRASADLYEQIADDLAKDLDEMSRNGAGHIDVAAMYSGSKGSKSAHGKAAAKLMALRMLCAGPYVLRQSGRRYLNAEDKPKKLTTITLADGTRKRVMKAPPRPGSAYAAKWLLSGALTDMTEHPKIDAVIERIDKLLDADVKNKIVVFSYFKDVLAYLAAQYVGECVIHNGDMSSKKKDEAKKQFQLDPDTRLFLSSDSGAYGVDLPQANWLINYDTPFSAGVKRQRDARIIRGSSLKFWSHVTVIDVLVDGSVEEHYYDKTQRKMKVGEAIKTGRASTSEVKMTAMSLSKFIATNRV